MFTYGSKYLTYYLKQDSKSFEDYMTMKPADCKPYDDKVDDLIVATLLIQNCSKPLMVTYLKNQFMTNSKECYPETPREACTLGLKLLTAMQSGITTIL